MKLTEIQINEIHMYCHTQGLRRWKKSGLSIKHSYLIERDYEQATINITEYGRVERPVPRKCAAYEDTFLISLQSAFNPIFLLNLLPFGHPRCTGFLISHAVLHLPRLDYVSILGFPLSFYWSHYPGSSCLFSAFKLDTPQCSSFNSYSLEDRL